MVTRIKILAVIICLFMINPSNAQWIKVVDMGGVLFYDVFFISKDTGFASGGKYANPDLYRTFDAGESWDSINHGITGYIESVNFINRQVGFVTSTQDMDSYIYKTVDQGETWYPVFTHPLLSWTVSFPTDSIGYAIPTAQENALITKTVDAGENWEIISSFWTEWGGWGVVDFQFLTEDIGYMIFESGVVYKTIDGGMNFEQVYLDFNYNLNSVFFLNPDTGYIAGEFKEEPFMNDTAGVVLKTVNGGIDWQVTILPGHGQDICFINPDTGYMASYEYMLETHNGGNSWQICDGYYVYFLYSVHFPEEMTGYAISSWRFSGGYSAVYKLDLSTGVNLPDHSDKMISIYPNPACDYLNVNIPESRDKKTMIAIYDLLGNKLLTEEFTGVNINLTAIPCGMYLLEVRSQAWKASKKFVLCR